MPSRPGSRNTRSGRLASGFTLTELLITIAIASTVAVLTMPVALRFYQNEQTEEVARTTLDALRRARTYAAAQENDSAYGVKILPGTLVLFQGNTYATRKTSEDENIDYSSNITVTSSVSEIGFSKLYATSTASTTVTIQGDSGPILLTVNNAGRIDLGL